MRVVSSMGGGGVDVHKGMEMKTVEYHRRTKNHVMKLKLHKGG